MDPIDASEASGIFLNAYNNIGNYPFPCSDKEPFRAQGPTKLVSERAPVPWDRPVWLWLKVRDFVKGRECRDLRKTESRFKQSQKYQTVLLGTAVFWAGAVVGSNFSFQFQTLQTSDFHHVWCLYPSYFGLYYYRQISHKFNVRTPSDHNYIGPNGS